jgi:hypothetical protein
MAGDQQSTEVSLDSRFCGPPGYGNGGYSCGLFARSVGSPATVTLRRPVPLDEPLRITTTPAGAVVEDREGGVVAEVTGAEPLSDLEPPRRPGPAEAAEASQRSPFRTERHPYPGCFVCGPEHKHGLHIHVGELDGEPVAFAASFTPSGDLADASGHFPAELVWAMLDCPSFVPSYWEGPPVALGRLTAELIEPVPAGQPLVAVSWALGGEGRKLEAASAVLDAEGRLLARARALWIRIDQPLGAAAGGD